MPSKERVYPRVNVWLWTDGGERIVVKVVTGFWVGFREIGDEVVKRRVENKVRVGREVVAKEVIAGLIDEEPTREGKALVTVIWH